MEDIPTKKCSKCGEELPLINFSKAKYGKDGVRGTCKKCESISSKINAKKLKEINFNRKIDFNKTKKCIKCGEEKPLDKFPIRLDSISGFRGECKECYIAYKGFHKDYNPDEGRKRYEKYHNLIKKCWRKRIDNFADNYITAILKKQGFPSDQITPEIIEAKRLIIKIKRKTQQNESKKS